MSQAPTRPEPAPQERGELEPPDQQERELVENLLRNHPLLTRKEALKDLRLHW